MTALSGPENVEATCGHVTLTKTNLILAPFSEIAALVSSISEESRSEFASTTPRNRSCSSQRPNREKHLPSP